MSRPSPRSPTEGAPTRAPAVAGRFYPAGPRQLADLVDGMLDAAPEPAADALAAAYVVPHAGYRYSGPTAAFVYARLRRHAGRVERVVLLGPAHFVPHTGCVAPAARAWDSPLGALPIDREAVRTLAASGHVTVDDRPHAPEHSLEVQLPFLRRALPSAVPLLPLLVGPPATDRAAAGEAAGSRVGEVLDAVAGPGTVVLCSTDLSHYLNLASARARDGRTVRAVLELSADAIASGDACGLYALRGLVGWARTAGLAAELLHQCTSADATADTSRVVGYAAFAFAGSSPRPRGAGHPA